MGALARQVGLGSGCGRDVIRGIMGDGLGRSGRGGDGGSGGAAGAGAGGAGGAGGSTLSLAVGHEMVMSCCRGDVEQLDLTISITRVRLSQVFLA